MKRSNCLWLTPPSTPRAYDPPATLEQGLTVENGFCSFFEGEDIIFSSLIYTVWLSLCVFYSSFPHSLIAHDIVYSVSVVISHFLMLVLWTWAGQRDGWGHLQGAVHTAAASTSLIPRLFLLRRGEPGNEARVLPIVLNIDKTCSNLVCTGLEMKLTC